MTEPADAAPVSLNDIVARLAELQALFQRRLLEDKPKNQLIEQLQRHLVASDEIARGEAFASVFTELLLVVDRLQSEEASAELNGSIVLELLEVLARRGVAPVPDSGVADPRVHEIVATIPPPEGASPGEIVAVRRRGYTVGGRLLRAARVVVAESEDGIEAEA